MKNNVVENLTKNRRTLIEVVVVAFLFGICASITGSIIFESLKNNILWLYSFLTVLLFGCIIFFFKNFSSARSANISVSGFIIYLKNENELKKIPRYQFSEEIFRFLSGAFGENEALRRQWEKEPLSNMYRMEKGKNSAASVKLIHEAVEYYALDTLSTHLTDYFNQEQYDESELKEFSREDVPDILLKNRFMELFSAPMENRSVFSDNHDRDHGEGVVVMSMGPNGAFYSRFDLTLPKDAVVTRADGKIIIETSKFKLTLAIVFEGTGYVTPINFEKYYLGLDDFENFSEFKVKFNADVKFKFLSTIGKSNWDYHSWLDGYFETMEREMSGDAFFKQINWETVATMIQCGEKMPNKSMQRTR